MPLSIIPERGHVSENSPKSSDGKIRDVLHDDELGSKLANETGEVSPETRSLAIDSRRGIGRGTDILAGETAGNDIDRSDIDAAKRSDVIVYPDAGPALSENPPASGFDFTECDSSHAGSFEAETEAANAAEKVEDIHLFLPKDRGEGEGEGQHKDAARKYAER